MVPPTDDTRWRGVVAHELNNVLGVIRGNSELILESPRETELVSTCAEDILSACEALIQLSWRLQVTAGRVLLHPATVPVHRQVGEVHHRAHQMSLQGVSIEVDPSTPATILLDGSQLATALLHLVADGQSCGATAARVNLRREEGALLFEIRDNRKPVRETTRLRSALTYSAFETIVREMGGQLDEVLDNENGLVVKVRFPLAEPVPVSPEPKRITAGGRILVVDDEFAVGRMVGRMLERAGWSVETYTSPLDALERLQNDPEAFDMALFDVMMPELSGPELLEAVRGRGISLPVVFMTGSAPANTQTMDARAILSKPFSKHQLLQVLQLDSASS